jgi:hypothetical protein
MVASPKLNPVSKSVSQVPNASHRYQKCLFFPFRLTLVHGAFWATVSYQAECQFTIRPFGVHASCLPCQG